MAVHPQFGLGLKTHALLTAAGIESVVVLDSAVAYVMAKVSLVATITRRELVADADVVARASAG